MRTVRRTLDFQTRADTAGDGRVIYTASTQAIDSTREVICCDGWKPIPRNTPFVDSHRYDSIEHVLGKVVSARVEKGRLVNEVQFSLGVGHDLAERAYKMVKAGMLPACSVGFQPLKWLRPDDAGFKEKKRELGIAANQDVRTIWIEQQQLELSACVIARNPEALVAARARGVLSARDSARPGSAASRALDDAVEELLRKIPFPDLVTPSDRRRYRQKLASEMFKFPDLVD